MSDHLESAEDGTVTAKSRDGEKTIELLNLNGAQRVEFRKAHLALTAESEVVLAELRRKQRYFKKKLHKLSQEKAERIRERLAVVEARITRIQQATVLTRTHKGRGRSG